MKKYTDAVSEFHKTFKVEQNESPTLISEEDWILRHKLMKEENQEYIDACATNDLVEVADALGDQLYILCGTILKHGMQHKIEEIFDEIQKSNLSKLDEQGNPIFRSDGKILKGVNYFEPNIKNILDV
jgi:predicted HAD superfamily Cof-like phosphohydrolase|tara:strand:+ start:3062 stop:3445 length:384 start_codon:yes stop_codon:yes gene_type:complete